jgi:hypothetical protein
MADVQVIANVDDLENNMMEMHDAALRMADCLENSSLEEATAEFDTMRAHMEAVRVYLTALEAKKNG